MTDKTQKGREEAFLASVADLIEVYTSPRHPGSDSKLRSADITGVDIDADGLILTAYEADDQKRGVRIGIRLKFDLLPVLSELLVTMHRDHAPK